jgi:branched-chain amino acid transport system ATP-binding protein
MLLRVDGLSAGYGPLQVIRNASLAVAAGESVALLGVSGGGKTTFLKTIAGLIRPSSGAIVFAEEDVAGLPAHQRVKKGLVLVPEGRRLFVGMSVRDNLLVGAHTRADRTAIRRQLDFVFELFPILADRHGQIVGTLSGGEQQMCAIGRALMSSPRLVLIDELSLGLAPLVVDELENALGRMQRAGGTVLLVEQEPDLAIRLSNRVYVMEQGSITPHSGSRSGTVGLTRDPNAQSAS